MDVAEVYRTLGRLEEAQSQNREFLVRIEQWLDRQEGRFDRQEDRNEQRFSEVNRRIDRSLYAIVGMGAAIIVGYGLQQVFGG